VLLKTDLKKELKELYSPSSKKPSIADVPSLNFLMIDGAGDPNTSKEYQDALEALYGVSYTLKFMLKKEVGADFTVMPLEGLWWMPGRAAIDLSNKAKWQWTSMMVQPDPVTKTAFGKAVEELRKKRNPSAVSKIRFEAFHEGLSVQIMYFGPYAAESPTIEKLHEFAKESGYKLRGKHHEIYLSDPRRTAPEKLKTVIRQPVE
jgi:hypothetical protein